MGLESITRALHSIFEPAHRPPVQRIAEPAFDPYWDVPDIDKPIHAMSSVELTTHNYERDRHAQSIGYHGIDLSAQP